MVLKLPQDTLSMLPAPSTPRLAAKYQEILEAALPFAQREYQNIDLIEIAEAADIAASTVFRYFPSAAHLLLTLHREQLKELRVRAEGGGRPSAGAVQGRQLCGVAIELLHMRLAQPAVNSCIEELLVPSDHELAGMIGEVDELTWSLLGRLAGGATGGRSIALMISGLVPAVRTGRLLPSEAGQQLRESCELLAVRR